MKQSLFDFGVSSKNHEEENKINELNFKNNKFNNQNLSEKATEKNNQNINNEKINENLNKNFNYKNFEGSEAGQQAKNIYEKYKGYSQDELMQEFLSTTKQKLSNGSLNKTQLDNTISKLIPFLNDSQKEILKGLINKLDV